TQLKQYGSCYFLDTPSLGCTIKSVFTGCVMIWSRLERGPLSLEALRRHRLRHTHSHTHTHTHTRTDTDTQTDTELQRKRDIETSDTDNAHGPKVSLVHTQR